MDGPVYTISLDETCGTFWTENGTVTLQLNERGVMALDVETDIMLNALGR